MPQLQSTEKITRFALPSTAHLEDNNEDKAWVDLDVGPLTANDVTYVDPSGTDVEATFAMLAIRVKDWNYVDSQGNKLVINVDNIRRLDMSDYAFLAEKIPKPTTELPADQKKTS